MAEPILKKFGKYFLLDRIGEGGMAEIFRARLADRNAADRLVVIKRIHAASSSNPEFVQMFKAEIQVTMRFSHPNIVQLYEAGQEDNQQYIAMELVEGKNLRQILSKLSTQKAHLPIDSVCYIIEQIASGLHYAHTFRDKITGEPLNIVHRDVSPQNILVSYEGNIKIIDFGIAKAATNTEATRAGVIKGKLSYLSPEQVVGDTLDSRSDVFALGVVLWEALVGKRLFVSEGDNDFQVLKMIEACQSFVKQPSELNPMIPAELDYIVLQALARDKKRRFQTADELAKALRRFLVTSYPEFSSGDLSSQIKKMFSDQIVEDRKSLQNLNKRSEELLLLQTPSHSISAAAKVDETRVSEFIGDRFDRKEIEGAKKLEMSASVSISAPKNQVIAKPMQKVNSTIGTAQRPRMPYDRTGTSTKSGHRLHQSQQTKSYTKPILWAAMIILGIGLGWDSIQSTVQQYITKNRGPASQVEKLNQASPIESDHKYSKEESVRLILQIEPDIDPSQTKIMVNRKLLPSGERSVDVPVGEALQIKVEHEGFVSYSKDFAIKSKTEDGVWIQKIILDPMNYGRLSVRTSPAIADVRIVRVDNRGPASHTGWTLRAPFEGQKIPVGQYKLFIENSPLGMTAEKVISVRNGSDLKLNVRLKVK